MTAGALDFSWRDQRVATPTYANDSSPTGGTHWTTIPVALNKGGGTFNVTNEAATGFPAFSNDAASTVITGRAN